MSTGQHPFHYYWEREVNGEEKGLWHAFGRIDFTAACGASLDYGLTIIETSDDDPPPVVECCQDCHRMIRGVPR